MPLRRTGNHPRCGSELAFVVCETGTLLIGASWKTIQCLLFPQPLNFCSVPYIGFTAGTRKHCDARNVTHL